MTIRGDGQPECQTGCKQITMTTTTVARLLRLNRGWNRFVVAARSGASVQLTHTDPLGHTCCPKVPSVVLRPTITPGNTNQMIVQSAFSHLRRRQTRLGRPSSEHTSVNYSIRPNTISVYGAIVSTAIVVVATTMTTAMTIPFPQRCLFFQQLVECPARSPVSKSSLGATLTDRQVFEPHHTSLHFLQ